MQPVFGIWKRNPLCVFQQPYTVIIQMPGCLQEGRAVYTFLKGASKRHAATAMKRMLASPCATAHTSSYYQYIQHYRALKHKMLLLSHDTLLVLCTNAILSWHWHAKPAACVSGQFVAVCAEAQVGACSAWTEVDAEVLCSRVATSRPSKQNLGHVMRQLVTCLSRACFRFKVPSRLHIEHASNCVRSSTP